MTSASPKIAELLRMRIAQIPLDDRSALRHALNGVVEESTLLEGTKSALRAIVDEGAIPIVKTLTGKSGVEDQLQRLADGVAKKRHLSPAISRDAVQLWASALGVLSLAPDVSPTGSKGGSPLDLKKKRQRKIAIFLLCCIVVFLIGFCVAVEMIPEFQKFVGKMLIGIILYGTAYGLAQAWPFCKLIEGVKQIKLALDCTPGWVYVVGIVTLGILDWFHVLPFGCRELSPILERFLQELFKTSKDQTKGSLSLPTEIVIFESISFEHFASWNAVFK